mmetsp:Transcript_25595/g.74043  ORF Transcript_25595/g.74043 Transcript_25595/m.74043 type:complete len:506 (-) Transcript_25595:709-2226(-)|eukprot:CAMPEP_0181026728 /NCGR_PEP_ID=MMETSP1070-20121207/3794_1 /TAXON_ID=265543 /ORGANISM="Minutocellus polymorphus, Strain NH13" /LENGTH=505 /DNA_ID=CAMNT_0023103939 /DNA_START=157 /DNA_END=1674 /DNA_ORIENTATION=+
MGNEASTYDDPEDKFDGIDTLGYRVLGVQPNSPASSAGLVSFFDFLVGCNGRMLLGRSIDEEGNEIDEDDPDYDDVDFPALLRESVGVELDMLVWNIKSQTQRIVKLTPSKNWGGTGLLGVTIRLDDYAEADERLIRVLSVEHNSPAAIAGLDAEADYLLGTTTVSFDTDAALAGVLRQHVDKVVELYVYNTNSDVVRVVTLMPTTSWGGQGLLGAEVGTGYLHRLPHQCRGTLGSSVERKVRTSAIPAAAAAAAAPTAPADTKSSTQEGGQVATDQPHQSKPYDNGKVSASEAPNASEGPDAGLLVDLTASGSEPSAEIHLEPQLELEPDPDDPGAHHRSAFAVAELHAAAAAQEQEKKRQEVAQRASAASASAEQEQEPNMAEGPISVDEGNSVTATEAVAEEPAPSQSLATPPPPPPAVADAEQTSAVPPPPPPPPAMNGMAAPPSFGESLQSSPYVPRKSDADGIPPPPPPPPAMGQFGLPPPPMAVVPDSPKKTGEVDLR